MRGEKYKMKNNKLAISLILLVITVIVMIILTGAIILTLSNVGIITKAENVVDETNLEEVQTIASLIWSEAFVDPDIDQTSKALEAAVIEGLQKEGIDTTQYIIIVNDEGVRVHQSEAIEKWKENIIEIVDGVPIPKGFVASKADGENTKNGGLVIYEGTGEVTNYNVEKAKRTRNQYVWVPVENFSKFKRGAYNNKEWPNILGKAMGFWEVVLNETTNMPLATQDTRYMTSTTLKEVQEMYKSVKEYKGFYIARYETGIDRQRNATYTNTLETKIYSMMGKIPYTHVPWAKNDKMDEDTGGAVEVARKMYPATNTKCGVVSTLIYGVQWDTTLAWWLQVNAKDEKGNVITSVKDSMSYGNHRNNTIVLEDLNDGAKYAVGGVVLGSYQTAKNVTKESGTAWALTTGALKTAKVNNIYDLAGNMRELIMAGYSSVGRVARGSDYSNTSNVASVTNMYGFPHANYSAEELGFRLALYIKI